VKYELGFYIPKDGILHSHRRENLKSYKVITGYETTGASVWNPGMMNEIKYSFIMRKSRGNSVGMATGDGLDDRGVRV
jgi:hypothetical protein